MEQTETLRYGSELRRFNVVGVTFKNKDGEDRQSIIERLQVGSEYNVRLERYLYEGEPAYYVVINEKIVGNVPKDLAAEFAAKEDQDYWLLVAKAGVHGGGPLDDDGEFPEEKSYGVHVTVKIVSPAEQKARHMWVDDNGNLHQDKMPERDSSPVTKVEIEPKTEPQSRSAALRPWGFRVILGLIFACSGFVNIFGASSWRMLMIGIWVAALGIWLVIGGITIKLDNDEALKAPDPIAVLKEQRQKPKKLLDRWWVWFAVLFVAASIGTSIDSKLGQSQGSKQTQATSTKAEQEAEETVIPDPVTYSGYGDDYFEIASFDGLYYFEISGNSCEAHFAVKGYDAAGKSTELFVNTTEYYTGYVLDPGQDTRYLEINCEDNWTVRIMSIYTCPVLEAGKAYNGKGDDVLILPGSCRKADIRGNSGEAHFAVETYGGAHDLLVNTTKAYDGTVRVDPEATIMTINAEGSWAVKVYN